MAPKILTRTVAAALLALAVIGGITASSWATTCYTTCNQFGCTTVCN